jgi:ankyrin repeat protein
MKPLYSPLSQAQSDYTELHNSACFARNDNLEPILSLINAKADPNARDNQGQTILHKLACNGDSNKDAVISLLIDANANVNAQDNQGRTPLFEGCSSRGANVEMALINKNANITHQDHNGNTFLHNLFLSLGVFDWSIKIGYAAGQVIQHQPYMLNLANKDGKTPLSCAAFGNKEKQEGESISNLGLRHAAFLIKLAQAKNAAISVSSDELDRLNLALTVSTTLNNTQENQENSNNITTLSLFLAQQLPESLELTGHDDDDYLGVD